MKRIILLAIIIFSASKIFAQSDSSIIISEIMFNPTSGNNEFVELYNLSSTQSINLANWKIKYYTSTADQIVSAGFGTVLPPNTYAIIFENDYDLSTGIYSGLVPANALILKIADNFFGTSGMANTTSRPVWLLRANNDTIDAYTYSANNSTSFSDEKILMNRDSSQTNWANSFVANGTPGFKNSVSPSNYDLQLSSLTFNPPTSIVGNNVEVIARIKNLGIFSAQNFSFRIFNDVNFDSTAQINELIFQQNFPSLSSFDSITVTHTIISPQVGTYQIIALVVFNEDENPNNNRRIGRFTINPPGAQFNDIVINEIMYAPVSPQPEWVELFNKSSNPINLKHWRLFDAVSSVLITTQNFILPPDSFLVITADTSIQNYFNIPSRIIRVSLPSLSNSGDAIVIKDSIGRVIDSLFYRPHWGGNIGGRSLERISSEISSTDSSNWKTSISKFKATPGQINSVTQKDFDIIIADILFNPKFPIAGNNVTISAVIKNIGRNNATFSIQLFEDTDLDSIPDFLLETINQISVVANDSTIRNFSYLIQNIQNEKGFLVKAVYSSDQDTSNNYLYKIIQPGFSHNSVVINEIMFAPIAGEPEWIEIYNQTNTQINLNGWKISDVISTPQATEIKNNFIIQPKSYAVIAKDTSIINYHRIIPSPILRLSFASLNNDVDGVVLRDNRGFTIDSVLYSNQWGGINGYSLERISFTSSSNLSSNWGSSLDIEQSTPGRINSLTPKQNDLAASDLLFTPRFPTINSNVTVSAKVKNFGLNRSSSFQIKFFVDTDSNNIVDQLLGTANSNNIDPSDSLIISCPNNIQSITKKILVAAEIIYQLDDDTLNNYVEKFIEPGFAEGLIKISEVMYNPADNKPEWIEFFNASNDSINIRNWSVSDIITTPTKGFITNQNIFIKPNEYFIVTKDTSFIRFYPEVRAKIFYTNFGTLGNSADGIILYDFRNGIIDSLFYRSTWGNIKDISLERISFMQPTNDSTNWTLSLSRAGSTPGIENSISNAPVYQRNSLIINEIMFEPNIDNSEFIEFYNTTDDSINIGGWYINDENNNKFRLSNSNYNLPPKSFFLLAADSITIFKYNLQSSEKFFIVGKTDISLSNSGESILLKDVRGRVIDSVFYSPKWHNKNYTNTKNISLERINPFLNSNDPANWNSCVSQLGATPIQPNSIFTTNPNNQTNLSVSPNPFSPDNDGFEDFCIINYKLTQPVAQVRIKIFDSKGRLVRTLLNNQPSGSTGSIIFDGLDDDGRTLRIGIYIIFLEALNDNSGVVETSKTVVVVARKL